MAVESASSRALAGLADPANRLAGIVHGFIGAARLGAPAWGAMLALGSRQFGSRSMDFAGGQRLSSARFIPCPTGCAGDRVVRMRADDGDGHCQRPAACAGSRTVAHSDPDLAAARSLALSVMRNTPP